MHPTYSILNNLNWDDVRFFLAAAEGGSLSEAARQLGAKQPTVGRRIEALEQALGIRLFSRHPRGLTLTSEGVRILEAARAMESAAGGLRRAGEAATEVAGSVRISAPVGLAAKAIAARLGPLIERYPALQVTLHASESTVDLAKGEADLAVRLFRPSGGDLVIKRVATLQFGLFASEGYIARHGVPATPAELARHRLIGCAEGLGQLEENRWFESLTHGGRVVLRSDCPITRFEAVLADQGIMAMPDVAQRVMPQLRRILPQQQGPSRPIWLVVHRDLRHIPRVLAVMEYLSELFEEISRG